MGSILKQLHTYLSLGTLLFEQYCWDRPLKKLCRCRVHQVIALGQMLPITSPSITKYLGLELDSFISDELQIKLNIVQASTTIHESKLAMLWRKHEWPHQVQLSLSQVRVEPLECVLLQVDCCFYSLVYHGPLMPHSVNSALMPRAVTLTSSLECRNLVHVWTKTTMRCGTQ